MSTPRKELENANVRIERIVWLDGIDWNSPGDTFKEMAEFGFDTADKSADWLKNPPEWVDPEDEESLLEWLFEKRPTGYLVEAHRPIPKMWDEHTEEFSWGYYRTTLFWADSVEATVPLIVAWADGMKQQAIEAMLAARKGGAA